MLNTIVDFFKNIKYIITNSSYLKTIILFLIIILILNLILIATGQFDPSSEEKLCNNTTDIISNTIYFTTTQFSTIGYGDISPKTNIAKFITSITHFLIMFVSLKIIEEFGILPTLEKDIKDIKATQKEKRRISITDDTDIAKETYNTLLADNSADKFKSSIKAVEQVVKKKRDSMDLRKIANRARSSIIVPTMYDIQSSLPETIKESSESES